MSCKLSNKNFDDKPVRTESMKQKNQDYVWREVKNNPNLYCWIPASNKEILNINWDIDDANIQDIPPPAVPDNYDDIVATIAEESESNRQRALLKQTDTGKDVVSADDPAKYPIVKKFIHDKGLKLYGGAAINMYLPKAEKFYNSRDIPDYDFYSPDPWTHAVELADILHKAGYQYTEARAGIHKGTYKVFANLWPVADVSYLPQEEFDRLDTKIIGGIKVASSLKLIEAMYKEFSEPYANPARWPKVAVRERLLKEYANPISKRLACSKDLFNGGNVDVNDVVAVLLEASMRFINSKKLIYSGPIAYNTYIEVGGGGKRVVVDHYEVLSEESHDDIQELFTVLVSIHEDLEIITIYKPGQELNSTSYQIHAIVGDTDYIICEIISLLSCTPTKKIFNRNIVGIDYLMYTLYNMAVFGIDKETTNDAKCKIRYITKIQNNYYHEKKLHETDNSPFQRFITTCKGPVHNRLKIELLNRWFQRVERDKLIKRKRTSTHYIRIMPKEEIPQECKDLPANQCRYPCAWNKYIGKCTDIPKGIYRPGEMNDEAKYLYK